MTSQPLVQSVPGELIGLIFQTLGRTKILTGQMVYDGLSGKPAKHNLSYLTELLHTQDFLAAI